MTKTLKAHLAALVVNLIYGANFAIAKGIMPNYLPALGFVALRVISGLLLFFLFHTFFIKEKVQRKDWPTFVLCGITGVAINQMLFFKGLSLTSPINGAIIMTSSPILVLIMAAIVIKEKITQKKVFGIVLGISGALLLLLFGTSFKGDLGNSLGDLYIFINALSWGTFLVITKPLMQRYHPITVMKWSFFFGMFFVMPFGLMELKTVAWHTLPGAIWLGIAYVLLGTTFLAYLLNTYSLKALSPSVVSFYIYLQPFFATAISLSMGTGHLSWIKVFSALLIFTGVFLVSWRGKSQTA